jgi:hypothetical protein
MIHGQQKRIRCEAMFENEHILLVKAPFCASGVGSGLATRVSLILLSRGGVGGGPTSDHIPCRGMRLLLCSF